jgi:hypothetical protein
MIILFAIFLIGLIAWGYPILLVALMILSQPEFWIFVGVLIAIVILFAVFSRKR